MRKPQLIVALDVDTLDKAKQFVDTLYPAVGIFKVGLQLFTAAGPCVVEEIRGKGAQVFLDLKLHDIPNTVANAVRRAARLKVKMLTLHCAGGEAMLKAAVAAADEAKEARPLLIGVTVLTSQEANPQEVLRLAKSARACGLDGVVASVQEAAALRKECGKGFIIITPGIRPEGAEAGDQKRVATADDAVRAGSDYIVVGRPILEAKDPRKAAEEIFE